MSWWSVILAAGLVALVYAFRQHMTHGRRQTQLLRQLADTHRGRLEAGSLLRLPRARLERGGMVIRAGSSATSGLGGTTVIPSGGVFTYVELDLGRPTGISCQALSRKATGGPAIDTVALVQDAGSGNEDFDRFYRVRASAGADLSGLLDAPIRARLLGTRLALIDVRLEDDKVSVHSVGLPDRLADLEEMIEIAELLAVRCPQARHEPAAGGEPGG